MQKDYKKKLKKYIYVCGVKIFLHFLKETKKIGNVL